MIGQLAAQGEIKPKTVARFTRNLKVDMEGEDIRELQKFLNTHGFIVDANGPGSPGNETAYFGKATLRALIKFQEAYRSEILVPAGLSAGSGSFGPWTMKKILAILFAEEKAVCSDTNEPFICPAIPPVPACKLGVDRTESFRGADGTANDYRFIPALGLVVLTTPPPVTVGTLTALPSLARGNITLKWGDADVPGRTTSIERWIDGATPTQITTVANTSQYVDSTAEINRIYYYRVSSGANTSNTPTAVISDTNKPFICPATPPVPASKLGVDRTESFRGADGTEVGFTIRAPVPKSMKVDVPSCDTTVSCSDYINVKNAIAQVIAAGGGTVQLAAGDYYLRPPPDTPEWLSAIVISYASDFILAGAGLSSDGIPLTHLYSDPAPGKKLAAIGVHTGNRVLIKDLSVDFAPTFAFPGVITDAGTTEQRFTITDDPAYYIPDTANPPKLGLFVGYNFVNRAYIHKSRNRAMVPATFNPQFSQDGKYFYSWPGQWFPNRMTAVGIMSTGGAVHVAYSNDTSIENVHVYGAGGPGIIVSDTGKNIRLSNVKIIPKPNSLLKAGEKPRFISIWGDSDSNNHHGGLLIENAEFAMIDDDFWNVKGPSRQLSEVQSTTGVRFAGGYTPTSVRVGNELSFIDPETLAPIGKPASITSYALDPATGINTVQFTPAMPELQDYIERPAAELPIYVMPKYSSNQFIIRNGCFRDSAGGRILVQGGDGLIENNVIANSGSQGIDLAGYPVVWKEGPGAHNVIVRNNKLIGTGVGYYQETDARTGQVSGGASGLLGAQVMLSAIATHGFYSQAWPIHAIEITDNFFSNSLGLAVLISSAHGVKVQNNVIVDANAAPSTPGFNAAYCGANSHGYALDGSFQPWCMAKVAAQGSVMVTHSEDVVLTGNTFLGTSQGIFIDPSSTSAIMQ